MSFTFKYHGYPQSFQHQTKDNFLSILLNKTHKQLIIIYLKIKHYSLKENVFLPEKWRHQGILHLFANIFNNVLITLRIKIMCYQKKSLNRLIQIYKPPFTQKA